MMAGLEPARPQQTPRPSLGKSWRAQAEWAQAEAPTNPGGRRHRSDFLLHVVPIVSGKTEVTVA